MQKNMELEKLVCSLNLCGMMAGYYHSSEFINKYIFITGIDDEQVNNTLKKIIDKKLSQDEIISIALMGYSHEEIDQIIASKEADNLLHLILKYRIYPRSKLNRESEGV